VIRARPRFGLLLALVVLAAGALKIAFFEILPPSAEKRLQNGLEALQQENYGEAYWWWRPLADRGMPEAQYHLAWLYANGNGLAVNIPLAIEWWRKASERDYTDAEFAIGMSYLNGQGRDFKADFTQAGQWLLRAARNDSEDAREILLRLLRSDTGKLIGSLPEILAEPWLGDPVRVTATEGLKIFVKRSRRAEVLAEVPTGTRLRKINQAQGWQRVVLSDGTGLGWMTVEGTEPFDEAP